MFLKITIEKIERSRMDGIAPTKNLSNGGTPLEF
jgi:hypothetical protein